MNVKGMCHDEKGRRGWRIRYYIFRNNLEKPRKEGLQAVVTEATDLTNTLGHVSVFGMSIDEDSLCRQIVRKCVILTNIRFPHVQWLESPSMKIVCVVRYSVNALS